MSNKYFDPFLVHIGSAWIDVRGQESAGVLYWYDTRDKSSGEAKKGQYIRHYPRKLSVRELGWDK